MNSITQKFNCEAKKIIFSLKTQQIKTIINRQRLKFSYQEILYYVQIVFEHSIQQKTFKSLHKTNKVKVNYSCFMSNISLFSKLFKFLFTHINKVLNIKPSMLVNMVDTTLIIEKKAESIIQKDWDLGCVTTRIQKYTKLKTYICGSKGLVFLNKQGQIYYARLLNINFSDQNILKDFSLYIQELKGFVLADRGFNNKAVRLRINHIGNQQSVINMFSQNQAMCRLISPSHYKEKKQLTDKEKALYKRRWKIETVFQKLKHNYSDSKLNLTGKYKKEIKAAKFYCSLIQFNLSTLID